MFHPANNQLYMAEENTMSRFCYPFSLIRAFNRKDKSLFFLHPSDLRAAPWNPSSSSLSVLQEHQHSLWR